MARVNRKKRLAHLHRALARKNQERARILEGKALLQEWKKIRELSDEEIGDNAGYIFSILARIERLAREIGDLPPEIEQWFQGIKAERASLKADEAAQVRAIRMALNKRIQLRAEQVIPTGTICSVCRHRAAQTQAYGVWLCKRCARGLDELPKGRA